MSKYVFEPVRIPSGLLAMKFENNDGNSQTMNVSGNYILTIASFREALEDNGIGGVPKIADMELEVFDRGGIFHDSIFNKSNVTTCYANITLFINGTEYSVFYGLVDLSTLEYPSMYDDGDGKEEHTAKFVVLSVLSGLQTVPMTSLRDALNVTGYLQSGHPAEPACFVFIRDVLAVAYSYIYPGKAVHVSFDIPFMVKYTIGGIDYEKHVHDTLLFFKIPTPDDHFYPLFDIDNSRSFLQFGDVFTFVQRLCGCLLVYSNIRYDPSVDAFFVDLVHRRGGTIVTPEGELILSTEKRFYEYDAIRVYTDSAVNVDRRIYPNNDRAYMSGISDEQFDVVNQKLDFVNLLGLSSQAIADVNNSDNEYYLFNDDFSHFFTMITSDELNTTSWNHLLMYNFARFWAAQKSSDRIHRGETIGSSIYERTYRGIGIGENRISLLDKLLIQNVEHTIFSIERDFVANEMKVTCVEY